MRSIRERNLERPNAGDSFGQDKRDDRVTIPRDCAGDKPDPRVVGNCPLRFMGSVEAIPTYAVSIVACHDSRGAEAIANSVVVFVVVPGCAYVVRGEPAKHGGLKVKGRWLR